MTNLFLSRYYAKKWAEDHDIKDYVIVKRSRSGIDVYKIFISIEPHILDHLNHTLKEEGYYHDTSIEPHILDHILKEGGNDHD